MRLRPTPGVLGAVGAWLVGIALALWLGGVPGATLAGLLAIAASASLLYAYRHDEVGEQRLALLSIAPLHLALLATGGLASPILPLAAVWATAVAWATSPRPAIAFTLAGAAVLIGVTHFVRPVFPADVAASVLALAGGALIGAVLRRSTLRLRLQQRRLRAIEDEARRGMSGHTTGPGERVRLLVDAIESVREQTGAARAVLWDVDADNQRVVARVVMPESPQRPVNLTGSPLRWVWEEGVPLRLEGRASSIGALGPGGGACVVPVDADTILALEFDTGRLPPDVSGITDAGRYIGALLELQRAQGAAAAARSGFDGLLQVLEGLASASGAEAWAGQLAETARALSGGTGAAVGTWASTGGGRILAGAGDDGGPAAGLDIAATESEMALAARAGAPIRRDDLRSGSARLPVAIAGERWFARPRALIVLPLETADGVIGLLAIWNADASFLDEAGLATLGTLAPYAALQLRQLAMHDTLRERAERDALTRLPNRGAFDERLEAEIAHFRRYRRPASLILVDVDHFKRVNDTWGHDAGDVVLRRIAELVAGTVRATDFAARLGGEEFAVVLPETELDQAVDTAERIRHAVEAASIEYDGQPIPVRVSAGVSACPAVVGDPTELMPSADAALYASKQGGRNRVTSSARRMPASA